MASLDEFMSVFPDIVRDLTENECYLDIPEVTIRLAKVLEYNVSRGKRLGGLVASYKILKSVENLTPENIRLANTLGWCVEMLQGASLILDDIIDVSEMRHGLPCWYRNKEVGFQAINDVLAMILAEHFDDEVHRQAKPILLELGHFFQVENDFFDCFGDTDLVAKTCSDIREGKCSWLIVVVLEKATPQQTQILHKHYGVVSDESEQIVSALYEELDLPNSYAVYKENTFKILS